MSGQNLFDPANPKSKSQHAEQTVPFQTPGGDVIQIPRSTFQRSMVGQMPGMQFETRAETNPFTTPKTDYVKPITLEDKRPDTTPRASKPAVAVMEYPNPPAQSNFRLDTDSTGLRAMLEGMLGLAGAVTSEVASAAAPHLKKAVGSVAKSAKDAISFTFAELSTAAVAPSNPNILSTPVEQLSGIKRSSEEQQKRAAQVLMQIRAFKKQEGTIRNVHDSQHFARRDVQEAAAYLSATDSNAEKIKRRVFGMRVVRPEDRKLITESTIAEIRIAQKQLMQQSIASQDLPDTGSVRSKGSLAGRMTKTLNRGRNERREQNASQGS